MIAIATTKLGKGTWIETVMDDRDPRRAQRYICRAVFDHRGKITGVKKRELEEIDREPDQELLELYRAEHVAGYYLSRSCSDQTWARWVEACDAVRLAEKERGQ